MDKYSKRGHFVLFGPANVGKSTIIGYILTHKLTSSEFEKEVIRIKDIVGDNFQNKRLFSYFLDEVKDEYRKNTESQSGNTYGTSKYVHVKSTGDFVLIDTPGGSEYETQRYKGVALASVGIFAIEIRQLLNLKNKRDKGDSLDYLKAIKDFFCAWYVWNKLHGPESTIIVVTKCDLAKLPDDFETAKEILQDIIGDDIDKCSIIPTSIDIDKRKDFNVFTKIDESWYQGKTLYEEIRSKYFQLPSQTLSESLLAFYSKRENDSINSIRWKINQGVIRSEDRYVIAPVLYKEAYTQIKASVRLLPNKLSGLSSEDELPQLAFPGEIVRTTVHQISTDNSFIPKEDIKILNTSIIVNEEDTLCRGNFVVINVPLTTCTSSEEQKIKSFKPGTQLSLLWFSKVLPAKVVGLNFQGDNYCVKLMLLNTEIALPPRLFPKKTLIQMSPGNDFELYFNFECWVYSIEKEVN